MIAPVTNDILAKIANAVSQINTDQAFVAYTIMLVILKDRGQLGNMPDPSDHQMVYNMVHQNTNQGSFSGGSFGGDSYSGDSFGSSFGSTGFADSFESEMDFRPKKENPNTKFSQDVTFSDNNFNELEEEPVTTRKETKKPFDTEPPAPVITRHTIQQLVKLKYPLVSNCLHVPPEDYKSRVNLAVPISWDPMFEDNSTTIFEGGTKIHLFHGAVESYLKDFKPCYKLFDDNKYMFMVDHLHKIANRHFLKSENAAVNVRRTLFVNKFINDMYNIILRVSGSEISVDNGILDHQDLTEVLREGEEHSALRRIIKFMKHMEIKKPEDIEVPAHHDWFGHSIPIIKTRDTSVELSLLVASVPMYLDSIIHASMIKDIMSHIEEDGLIILRALDNDYIIIADKEARLICCSCEFYIP